MKYVNDFGMAPTRGTSKSVGIDFKIPDASKWSENQYLKFKEYLRANKLEGLLEFVPETAEPQEKASALNAILLYVSWDSSDKENPLENPHQLNQIIESGELVLKPRESVCVPTGIRTMFAPGYCGIFFNKSGRGKEGLVVKAQVIDEDYTGYVHINLANTSDHAIKITPGMKLSQLIELPAIYDEPREIPSEEYFALMKGGERGEGAFGHTNDK